MLGLANNYAKGYTHLNEIARGEGVSEKYLSLIVIPLRRSGLVTSSRGVHGGYALAKEPSQISIKDIVDALEGSISIVDCVKNSAACSRVPTCASRDIWALLEERIAETLSSINLELLVKMREEKVDRTISYNI